MEVRNHVIVGDSVNATRQVQLRCQSHVFTMPEQEIVVYRKNAFHRMNVKHVGDGMELVVVHYRPTIFYDLDAAAVKAGLGLYVEYEEEADAWKTYLYKFPKDEETVAWYNELFQHHALSFSLIREGRFVVLASADRVAEPEQLQQQLALGSYKAMLSFLFGLFVAYGSLQEKNEVVYRVQWNIPLVGSIVAYQSVIERVVKALADHGIYVYTETVNASLGGTIVLSTDDHELVVQFMKRFGENTDASAIAPLQRAVFCKEELTKFLHQQEASREFVEHVRDSVLKLLTK